MAQEIPRDPEKPDRLVSRQNAADRLGVSVDLVKSLEKGGALPPVRLTPTLVRLRQSDIDALIAGDVPAGRDGAGA